MTGNGKAVANFVKNLKDDYEFRTMVASVFSATVTLVFATYNVAVGIVYETVWSICIAVYYFLLVCLKFCMVLAEKRYYVKALTVDELNARRVKMLLWQSAALFSIDLSLLAPIIMMIKSEREINYSSIVAIMTAAYTVYKIVAASVNYYRTRKISNLSVRIIRDVYLKDALASVISLQYVLTTTFGDGMTGDMLTVSEVTGALLWLLIVSVSACSLAQAIKLRKSRKKSAASED